MNKFALALVLAVSCSIWAQADSLKPDPVFSTPLAFATSSITGSLGFDTGVGKTLSDGSQTGNINTSLAFTLMDLTSTANQFGLFSGMLSQDFGTVNFRINMPDSLHFGDSVFGAFAATSIAVVQNSPGFLNILAQGNWTPGTFNRPELAPGPFAGEFRMAFTQSPAHTGENSFSGTFDTTAKPAAVVPEPPSSILFFLGLAVLIAVSRLRSLLPSVIE